MRWKVICKELFAVGDCSWTINLHGIIHLNWNANENEWIVIETLLRLNKIFLIIHSRPH